MSKKTFYIPETDGTVSKVSLPRVSILESKHKFTAAEMREGMIARGLLARAENGDGGSGLSQSRR